MSRSARRARRARLFEGQGAICYYCEGTMRLLEWPETIYQPADMVTLEHVVQKVERGTYGDENTVAACASCNVSRPNGMSSDDYLSLRRSLLEMWPPCTALPVEARRIIQSAAPQTIYKIAHGAPS